MATYKIQFKRSARKDLRKLDKTLIQRLLSSIELLSDEPTPRNSRKLKGVEQMYRVRVGNHRIVYEINHNRKEITVYYIRHRDDVYRHI
ncbi:MAG: type II toxin-antitoxin system RelE family toxin [Candidatus Hodarchaeales archaeon]